MKSSFSGRVSTKGCSQECVSTLLNKVWEKDKMLLLWQIGQSVDQNSLTAVGSREDLAG